MSVSFLNDDIASLIGVLLNDPAGVPVEALTLLKSIGEGIPEAEEYLGKAQKQGNRFLIPRDGDDKQEQSLSNEAPRDLHSEDDRSSTIAGRGNEV